jgi:acetone carboxylase gamma subunit
MTEQFELSKKIFRIDVGNSRGKHRLDKRRNSMNHARLYVKDVKEFIRELKSYFKIFFNDRNWKNHEYAIDKLAGKELIEAGK